MNKNGARHTVLDDCPHCGRVNVIVPPLNKQVDTIINQIEYEEIQSAMRAIGYREIPTVGEMKVKLRKEMNEVIRRVRKTCDQSQISGCGGWYIWMNYGVINVRWSVTEYGWEP